MKRFNMRVIAILMSASAYALSSCYQLDAYYAEAEYPVAFGQHLVGYDINEKIGFISETLWVYHAADLGQLPMGSREGLAHNAIWRHTFQKHLTPGQGVHYLKIRQRQTFSTLITRLLTLGIISPTEVQIEGEIVSITPVVSKSLK